MINGLALISLGIVLVFAGAKWFFGLLFVYLGLLVLSIVWKSSRLRTNQKKEVKTKIRKIVEDTSETTEEKVEKIDSLLSWPVGNKLIIYVHGKDHSVNLKVPLSIAFMSKPLIGLIVKITLSNKNKFGVDMNASKEDLTKIVNAIIEELPNLYGDIVDVETADGEKVLISIR